MMHFGSGMSKARKMKLPRKHVTLSRDLPECWEICLMLHPPPHIWACPRDQSLQLLYLHYDTMLHTEITLQIYRRVGGAALPPCRLRGPPPLSPTHALPWHLVVTPAPAGLNARGSSHRPWCQSLTVGHQK